MLWQTKPKTTFVFVCLRSPKQHRSTSNSVVPKNGAQLRAPKTLWQQQCLLRYTRKSQAGHPSPETVFFFVTPNTRYAKNVVRRISVAYVPKWHGRCQASLTSLRSSPGHPGPAIIVPFGARKIVFRVVATLYPIFRIQNGIESITDYRPRPTVAFAKNL